MLHGARIRLACTLVALFAAAVLLPSCQKAEVSFHEKYHNYFDEVTPDGFIHIESEPPGAMVFIVEGVGNYSSLGTTPVTWQCEASGRPYAFVLRMKDHFERRIDARPVPPDNTDITIRVKMHRDYANPLVDEPDLVPVSPYRATPEERNFDYSGGFETWNQPEARPRNTSSRWPGDQESGDE